MDNQPAPHCPINQKQVDAIGARLTAGIVLVWIVVVGVAAIEHLGGPGHLILLGLMALDFLVRGFFEPRWSPVATTARFFLRKLGVPPRPTNAAPKMFAAKIGFVFSIFLLVATLCGQLIAHDVIAAALAFCALLESALGVCVGCGIYQWLNRCGLVH